MVNLLIANGPSTIDELKRDYETFIGDGWLPDNHSEIRDILKTIPEVCATKNRVGTDLWMAKQAVVDHCSANPVEVEMSRKRKSSTTTEEGGSQKRQCFDHHIEKNNFVTYEVPVIDTYVPMVRKLKVVIFVAVYTKS